MVGATARIFVIGFCAAVEGCSFGCRFELVIERWNGLETSRME